MAVVAAAGQMIGKIVYYYLGKSSLEWRWVKRRTDTPRFQAGLERWRVRLEDRPWVAAAFVFLSASVGIPPFAIVAVLAGTLRDVTDDVRRRRVRRAAAAVRLDPRRRRLVLRLTASPER